MKSAVSAWSFERLISKGIYNHFTIIEKAKEFGFDAIEFIDLYVPEGKTELEYAAEIKAEADRVGIEISCYAVCADLLNGCDGDLEKEIERICRKVDVAEVLGARIFRHDITPHPPKGYKGYVNLLPRFVEAARAITDYAEKKGIRTCTENHGWFSQDSDRVVSLINATERDNFGILVDIGNFHTTGEDVTVAVGRCATYAFNVHVKDTIYKADTDGPVEGLYITRNGAYSRGTILGHGVIPIKQCVRALKRAGYDGYLTLEFEGLEDCEYSIQVGCRYIKSML